MLLLKKKREEKRQQELQKLGEDVLAERKRKLHERYLKAKAQGKPQAYYKKKMEEDPLYNRKAHIRRKRANPDWQTERGKTMNVTLWEHIVDEIRASEKSTEDLAKEMNEKYRIFYHSKEKRTTDKETYRPRIKYQNLTDKQLEELKEYTLKAGLSQEVEVMKTTVTYKDTMVGIDDNRKKKRVDIYTGHNKK